MCCVKNAIFGVLDDNKMHPLYRYKTKRTKSSTNSYSNYFEKLNEEKYFFVNDFIKACQIDTLDLQGYYIFCYK